MFKSAVMADFDGLGGSFGGLFAVLYRSSGALLLESFHALLLESFHSDQLGQPQQVVGGAAEDEDPVHLGQSAQLQPAEVLLHQPATTHNRIST